MVVPLTFSTEVSITSDLSGTTAHDSGATAHDFALVDVGSSLVCAGPAAHASNGIRSTLCLCRHALGLPPDKSEAECALLRVASLVQDRWCKNEIPRRN